MKRISAFAYCPSALLLVTFACGGAAEDAKDDVFVEPVVLRVDADDSGIGAQQVSGVWLFTHDEQAAADALFNRAASISQGCLLVGDAVPVWPAAHLDAVAEYVDAVQAGESVELMLAGEDGGVVPATIAEKCHSQSRRLWFANRY